ncbi:HIT-like protein [Piromyces finnis]|uniref:HIT-like protein n=1 Tax=Piromyces finnis TaxID=1754191 RepID=A0A1Y1V7A7_9FUNG|nr:HIT-like protein [Piromyces finnis]|eukprot:ORX48987.1 HIT-like protein [Piromyces finnis]
MKVDQLIFPFFSVKEGQVDLFKGIDILNESLSTFFSKYKDNNIEVILIENDNNVMEKIKEKCTIKDSRFKIINSEIKDYISKIDSNSVNFRYIASEISWRFKMSCTTYSQSIQKLIGVELINKVKEQYKTAILNKCYIVDMPKNSSLYTTNKIKKVILINTPNTNPERPNQIPEDQALMELKNSFGSLLKEFENILNSSKFLNLFKNPNVKSDNSNQKSKAKVNNYSSWNDALLLYIKHPEQYKEYIFRSEDKFLVVHDKFPKSKIHLLIIPKEEIKSIYYLNKSHISLVNEMVDLSKEIINELKKKYGELDFQVGFHAIPSMNQVHMHVITGDFISPSLKNKKHWNSFTTEFFLKPSFIIKQLENYGSIKIDKQHYETILKRPLKCHKCNQEMKNMPTLKSHLSTHISN